MDGKMPLMTANQDRDCYSYSQRRCGWVTIESGRKISMWQFTNQNAKQHLNTATEEKIITFLNFTRSVQTVTVWGRKVQLLVSPQLVFKEHYSIENCCTSNGMYSVSGVKSHFYQLSDCHTQIKRATEGMEREREETQGAPAAEWSPLALRWDRLRYCLTV